MCVKRKGETGSPQIDDKSCREHGQSTEAMETKALQLHKTCPRNAPGNDPCREWDSKDRRIATLEGELAQTQSKLAAAQKIVRKNEKGSFNVQENKVLAQNLKLIQRSNSEQRTLAHKNKFLIEINTILRKQLDEHLLRNFYKLQGWQENGEIISL